MAHGTFETSSVSWTQINPLNWDIQEILRYKEEECFTYDGKRFKWSETFEMLKIFTNIFVSQPGFWSASGGKYNKFCSSNTI